MKLSACIEMLFVEEGHDMCSRIRAAADAGFEAVEFWGWREKDVAALAATARETGLAVSAMTVDPSVPIVDSTRHREFVEAVESTAAVADEVACETLIVLSGTRLDGVSDDVQRQAVIDALSAAASLSSVAAKQLVLEPLNDRIEAPGYFLASSVAAASIVEDVARENVGLLYDVYHSAVMGESIREVILAVAPALAHVHVGDYPGRHEPGTGAVNWADVVGALRQSEYSGFVGLEYRPTVASAKSADFIRALVEAEAGGPC